MYLIQHLLANLLNSVKISPSASSPLSQEEHYRFHNVHEFDEVYPILETESKEYTFRLQKAKIKVKTQRADI